MPSSSHADIAEFKQLFSEVAVAHQFVRDHGGWFRESPECIVVLNLQRSNFGRYFELNVKVFVRGLFGESRARAKDMVKSDSERVDASTRHSA